MASQSFEDLLKAHLDDMYAFAFYLSGSKEAAEDLVQDLFVNLKVRNVNTDGVRNPRAWLASLLYRLFVDHWRKEKRSPICLAGDETQGRGEDCIARAVEASPGPDGLLQLQEEQQQLYLALHELSEKHKHLILLHDIQGYSLSEVEVILQVPVGTLKSRLHRAREKLLNKLQRVELRPRSSTIF
ncbi:MAG: RNA polymerase sigma factor [Gammaproteobacteria bacterium]|jgi:RNA polymerase sigma-70 factor (ECF subfamily)